MRAVVTRLLAAASFAPENSGFTRLNYASRLSDFFTPDVVIHLEGLGADLPLISGRTELVQVATGARAQLKRAEFQATKVDVKLVDQKRAATAFLVVTGQLNSQSNLFAQPIKLGLVKTNGHWLINRVNTVPPIQ